MSPYVARTKQDRLKLRDDRPQLDAQGRAYRLSCGCQLMREPDVSFPKQRWWCHGAWQTAVKR